jgi:hypothetical protein
MPLPKLNAPALIDAVGGKTLHIPPEGWNAYTFARYGLPMLLTITRVAKIIQKQATADVARTMAKLFDEQLKEIVARVTRSKSVAAKADITLAFDQHETLWKQAIDDVLKSSNTQVVSRIFPPIQSVMAQGYSKVGILLGQDATPDMAARIARQARGIAEDVTRVTETTRRILTDQVRRSIQAGQSVAETATAIQDAVPKIFGNRALTIARTELNKAWTQGAVKSFQESETLTHISVIGCEAREPSSPQYRGESTCNIIDVPVGDAGILEFHINHTGNMVPSRFRNEDGSMDNEPDRPAIFDDQSQAES